MDGSFHWQKNEFIWFFSSSLSGVHFTPALLLWNLVLVNEWIYSPSVGCSVPYRKWVVVSFHFPVNRCPHNTKIQNVTNCHPYCTRRRELKVWIGLINKLSFSSTTFKSSLGHRCCGSRNCRVKKWDNKLVLISQVPN